MNSASPESTAEVEIHRALSSGFTAPSIPIVCEPMLLRKKETSVERLENDQARLEAAFDALEQQIKTNAVEQKARTDALEQRIRTASLEPQIKMDSVQNYSTDTTPLKRDFSRLAYYAFSEFHLTRSRPSPLWRR